MSVMAEISEAGVTGQYPTVQRFYSLDALRGVAALCVVFFHWRHFFYTGTTPGDFNMAELPFSDWIFILYTKGWLAVDLFFCISGFVFYWLYSGKISEHAFPTGKFVLLRFSRLYPLHLATLLLVASAQFLMLKVDGSYFVTEYNDTKHFMLNLLFASSWGFEDGYSFNAPAWSISVEIVLYAAFFIICRLLGVRAILLVSITAASFLLVQAFDFPIARGLSSFFLGGCIYLIYQSVIMLPRADVIIGRIVGVGALVWLITLAFIFLKIDLDQAAFNAMPALERFGGILHWSMQRAENAWPIMVLFPMTVLSLALIETRRGSLGKRIAYLGDISYSSYMLHFPLQLAFAGTVSWLSIDGSIYYSPWFMLLFFIVLLSISSASYKYLEMPAQNYLRQFRVK
jgi:peptidoglycan/LPS O-acetylase OafA/YrhL